MTTRRNFLKALPLAAGAVASGPAILANLFQFLNSPDAEPQAQQHVQEFRAFLNGHEIPELISISVESNTEFSMVRDDGKPHAGPRVKPYSVAHLPDIKILLESVAARDQKMDTELAEVMTFMERVGNRLHDFRPVLLTAEMHSSNEDVSSVRYTAQTMITSFRTTTTDSALHLSAELSVVDEIEVVDI